MEADHEREAAAPPAGDAGAISLVDLFTIGIGPSSSHTVGPMRAALAFARLLADEGVVPVRVKCDLYGSLSLTGRGHGTDGAVLLGLAGETPEGVDPDRAPAIVAAIREDGSLPLGGGAPIAFDEARDLVFHDMFLPAHPNGMQFTAVMADGSRIVRRYHSIGGGAIRMEGEAPPRANIAVPHPFASAAELLAIGERTGLAIADIVRTNEAAWRDEAETDAFLDSVHAAMFAAIDRGCAATGELPGGLKVQRRARAIREKLRAPIPASFSNGSASTRWR